MNFTIYIDENGDITITDLSQDFIPLLLSFIKPPEKEEIIKN